MSESVNSDPGGYPGGVRARRRAEALAIVAICISGLLTFGVYKLFHSFDAVIVAGVLCGIATISLLPLSGTGETSSEEKRRWLIWFAPALLLELIFLVYFTVSATPNSELIGPWGICWLFGATAGGTYKALKW